jgi:uncharacterized protein DUF6228
VEARPIWMPNWWQRGVGSEPGSAVDSRSVSPKGHSGPTFVLSGIGPAKLILTASLAGRLIAVLEAEGVRARTEVVAGFDLPAFLKALQAPAWLGDRWLESPDGQLHLAATNEGGGKLRLVAELRRSAGGNPWRVELTFRLRQSQLGGIAERAQAFDSAVAVK